MSGPAPTQRQASDDEKGAGINHRIVDSINPVELGGLRVELGKLEGELGDRIEVEISERTSVAIGDFESEKANMAWHIQSLEARLAEALEEKSSVLRELEMLREREWEVCERGENLKKELMSREAYFTRVEELEAEAHAAQKQLNKITEAASVMSETREILEEAQGELYSQLELHEEGIGDLGNKGNELRCLIRDLHSALEAEPRPDTQTMRLSDRVVRSVGVEMRMRLSINLLLHLVPRSGHRMGKAFRGWRKRAEADKIMSGSILFSRFEYMRRWISTDLRLYECRLMSLLSLWYHRSEMHKGMERELGSHLVAVRKEGMVLLKHVVHRRWRCRAFRSVWGMLKCGWESKKRDQRGMRILYRALGTLEHAKLAVVWDRLKNVGQRQIRQRQLEALALRKLMKRFEYQENLALRLVCNELKLNRKLHMRRVAALFAYNRILKTWKDDLIAFGWETLKNKWRTIRSQSTLGASIYFRAITRMALWRAWPQMKDEWRRKSNRKKAAMCFMRRALARMDEYGIMETFQKMRQMQEKERGAFKKILMLLRHKDRMETTMLWYCLKAGHKCHQERVSSLSALNRVLNHWKEELTSMGWEAMCMSWRESISEQLKKDGKMAIGFNLSNRVLVRIGSAACMKRLIHSWNMNHKESKIIPGHTECFFHWAQSKAWHAEDRIKGLIWTWSLRTDLAKGLDRELSADLSQVEKEAFGILRHVRYRFVCGIDVRETWDHFHVAWSLSKDEHSEFDDAEGENLLGTDTAFGMKLSERPKELASAAVREARAGEAKSIEANASSALNALAAREMEIEAMTGVEKETAIKTLVQEKVQVQRLAAYAAHAQVVVLAEEEAASAGVAIEKVKENITMLEQISDSPEYAEAVAALPVAESFAGIKSEYAIHVVDAFSMEKDVFSLSTILSKEMASAEAKRAHIRHTIDAVGADFDVHSALLSLEVRTKGIESMDDGPEKQGLADAWQKEKAEADTKLEDAIQWMKAAADEKDALDALAMLDEQGMKIDTMPNGPDQTSAREDWQKQRAEADENLINAALVFDSMTIETAAPETSADQMDDSVEKIRYIVEALDVDPGHEGILGVSEVKEMFSRLMKVPKIKIPDKHPQVVEFSNLPLEEAVQKLHKSLTKADIVGFYDSLGLCQTCGRPPRTGILKAVVTN